jgi:glucose-6-phosphate dehydrogenase assembly protein OpcA
VDQTDESIHGGTVSAEDGNPTAELLTAWLASRLRVPFSREVTEGPGITGVVFQTDGGDITISRPDGRTATLSRPAQPDRHVALHRRDVPDLLAEELRRLNPDEVYGETLAAACAVAPERR